MSNYLIYAYIITFLALIILLLKSVIDFKGSKCKKEELSGEILDNVDHLVV